MNATIRLGRFAILALVAPALVGADAEDASLGYWAFQVPRAVSPPPEGDAWSRAPLDTFLLDSMREKELAPSRPASPERLLRRASLDLTGLPPTPEQAAAFLTDPSPLAYERLIDSLLASPAYGERWAQKWLDVVRFADTNGFEVDAYREHAWRYRDYVARAFNQDKPYDRFVREQVAGDELYPGDRDALLATGFHGAGPRHLVSGNQDEDEARQEVLTEMTSGIGHVFLALTVQCARCHDHKFDPISQADYYRLQAFFAATDLADNPLATDSEREEREAELAEHDKRLEPIKKQLEGIEAPYKEQVSESKRARLEPEFLAALETVEDQRDEETKRLAKEAESQIKAAWYEFIALMPADVRERRAELRGRLHALELERPDPPAAAYAVSNAEKAPESHVLLVGDHRRKGQRVEPAFLGGIGNLGVEVPRGPLGRRSALAEWLASREHPLTARVMVNRIWEFRMGQGLMADPNNLGALGGSPTHPELLDWLAERFVNGGWSVKAVDRMILLSSAYRQSAGVDPAKAAIDPDNRLLWRANRRRLAGETIRDSVLAASGTLNRELGGKPVRLPIEREVYDLIFTEEEPDNLWPVTPDRAQHDRRSLYLLNKRTVRLPFLANLDQPDTMTSCAVRQASTHAPQALTLLNSDFMQQQSRALAERLERDCGPGRRKCQIEQAYRLTLARAPTSEERRMATGFLQAGGPRLQDFSLAMLNRNEFLYRP